MNTFPNDAERFVDALPIKPKEEVMPLPIVSPIEPNPDIMKSLPLVRGRLICDDAHETIHREFSRRAWLGFWLAVGGAALVVAVKIAAYFWLR